ncbi:SLOG family protein [[Kitasatospora] papulosa]|uniref:SLOG family protein n=1 Tax=[Kitasatospora] papulosa TaxID=1464011 RepID=UPI0036947A02
MTPRPYRILITGSRDWTDETAISKALTALAAANTFAEQPTVIVHGACPTGADQMADDWARWHAQHSPLITVERHPANWDAHGRAAGPRRNAAMVAAGADTCLAFIRNGSRGATGCAVLAEQAGIPTRRYTA